MGRNKVDFDDQLNKSFRVVTTPSGHAKDFNTGEILPDDPSRFSIVTPLNTNHPPTDVCLGCSQWEWPTASPEAHDAARKDFRNLFTDRRLKYKSREIRKSMNG
jgi:hypothetical protein